MSKFLTGVVGRGARRVASRLRVVPLVVGGCLIVGFTAPAALASPAHGQSGSPVRVGPVSVVSRGCAGQNAEVEQAVAGPDYVYEAWIGCAGEGFARSTDGGKHFQKPITLPDSSGSDDPAVAVAPDGTLYVSYLRYHNGYGYPVVATSFDHGATFSQVSSLTSHLPKGNWGDRDFITAGRDGRVYVTWDYGPSAADVKIICSPVGSCAYEAVDATAVIQTSTDHGKTWGPITPMQPGFPAGGGYDASLAVQPNGRLDALIWGHRIDPTTFTVQPGHQYFTSSTDGGRTWSRSVEVGAHAGSIALLTWWIDGDLSMDRAGNLYATWDTQTSTGDVGWISYSTDHGARWSPPIRVTRDRDDAMHNVQVVGAGGGVAEVAWLADGSPHGYATYLRPFSITRGWLAPTVRVSKQYGDAAIWPGDTFGLSVLPGRHAPPGSERVAVSWGSAVGGSPDSQIYAATVNVPLPRG
jgi:hypothetical protein